MEQMEAGNPKAEDEEDEEVLLAGVVNKMLES